MDDKALRGVADTALQFASAGTYMGDTGCGLSISTDSGPYGPLLEISTGSLSIKLFTLAQSQGEYRFFLLGFNVTAQTSGGAGHLQIFVETDQTETPAQSLYVNLTAKNGTPSSYQVGVAFSPRGGGYGFFPGDVIETSQINLLPACSNLVKKL